VDLVTYIVHSKTTGLL